MDKAWDVLRRSALESGIMLTEQQYGRLQRYMEMLQQWNKVMNLTAISDDTGIIIKHFLDSLLYAKQAGAERAGLIMDLGTGAGLPGIPLKIWQAERKVILVDSSQKRLRFLQEVVASLQLQNIELVHARAEDLGQSPGYREKMALVLSRAVAPLPVLAEYCLPFVALQGYFSAAKGPDALQELTMAEPAITALGGKVTGVQRYELPQQLGTRYVINIAKQTATPAKYPRKAGLPAKKPLS